MTGGPARGHEGDRRPSVAFLDPFFEPLVTVTRGQAVESIHRGAIAVVDQTGALRGGAGDPATRILLRSSAKPFQAAAVVASGAADAFSPVRRRDSAHGSVSFRDAGTRRGGRPAPWAGRHTGVRPGVRVPGAHVLGQARRHAPPRRVIWASQERATSTRNTRSSARSWDTSPRSFENGPRRPGFAADGTEDKAGSRALFAGTDGCGVPVIGMSLQDAAWLFALLAAGATPALARVRDAMLAHPLLVAGEGRLDTNLIRAGAGGIVAKGGAEGVQGIGLRADPGGPGALGCAVKIEDGAGRPVPVVVATFLGAWGLAREAAAVMLDHSPLLRDRTGREVGGMEAVVEGTALRRRPGRALGHDAGPLPAPGVGREAARAGGPEVVQTSAGKWRLFARRGVRVTVSRGDEKDVLRFLREQWPAVDREYFGRSVDWTAEPYALVYRWEGEVTGVLRGHFIGGLASVDELMVKEGARGRGVGSLLLGRFEEEARKRQCSRIVLRAVKDTRAEDFYRKRGYHRECVQHGYEFGYDYVRLVCDTGHALGEAGGGAGAGKGEME